MLLLKLKKKKKWARNEQVIFLDSSYKHLFWVWLMFVQTKNHFCAILHLHDISDLH